MQIKTRRAPSDRILPAVGWTVAVGVPVVFLTIFFLLPFLTLVGRGFMSADGALDLSGFAEVLTRSRTWRVIWQTVWMSSIATVLSVLVSVPAAWVLYRTAFPGRGFLRGIVAVPFVLPSVVVGVAFRSIFTESGPLGSWQLDGTQWAIIIGMVFFNYSVGVRTLGNMWVRLDPRAEQAAAALGARPVRMFFTVTLPRLMPALASAAAVIFLFCATSFGLVLILGGTRTQTVETEIYFLTTALLDLRSASVLSIVQLVVIALALWMGSAARRAGAATQTMRTDLAPRPVSKADVPALVATIIPVLVLLIAPLAYLFWRSLHRSGEFTLANYAALFDADAVRVLQGSVMAATWRSIEIALVAMIAAVIVGVLVSIVVTRRPKTMLGKRLLAALDGLFMLPLGVSAVTVGFGFLIALDKPPIDLRGSFWLIPMAQAMVAIPLVVRVVTPVLASIDPRQREVATVLGAGPARSLVTVEGPYVLRSLTIGAAFAFSMSLGEFGATSFLARPGTPTLPVAIYRLISEPGATEQGMALAASVVLALLAGSVMALVEARADSTSGGRVGSAGSRAGSAGGGASGASKVASPRVAQGSFEKGM
ncbi:MAG: iron ABC transporter permease [Actinomycetaceae bacterium]|nr:iron ABC transporter permease [Actinomycetaceae bacterium]